MAVLQRTFSPDAISHWIGAASDAMPLACGPRNCGQFAAGALSNRAQSIRVTRPSGGSRWICLGFMEERIWRWDEVGDDGGVEHANGDDHPVDVTNFCRVSST